MGVGVLCLFFAKPGLHSDPTEIEVIEAPHQAPKVIQISQAPPRETPKHSNAVYGVSRKSLTSETEGEEVKAGNTIAKTPDDKKLKATDPDSLPIPTDEYLVSQMPTLAEEVRIPYPADAKKKEIEGAVVMDLLIDDQGRVRQATLVQGLAPDLNEAALAAVKGFKFKPAMIQDKPVAVKIRYAYRFVLER